MAYGIVYLIRCKISCKDYVGQTVRSLEKRWAVHVGNRNYNASRMPIASAIAKYGKGAFTIEMLEECDTQQKLDECEVYWVSRLNTFAPHGYNLRAGKGNGTMSEITRERIRTANIGHHPSPETIQRLRNSHLGFKVSDATKKKLSDIFSGRMIPKHVRKAASRKNARTFSLINPDGRVVRITNMSRFCTAHGYNKSRMSE